MGSVVALSGQIGGAKLADGFYRLVRDKLSVIVNTGDDDEMFGLSISPDVDTMLYTLSGIADPQRGWEPTGETFGFHDMLKRLGGPDNNPLGDRGLALQLLRAEELRSERRLTEITHEFSRRLGITASVLPMSDDPVRTFVDTEAGQCRFQEYFGDLHCEPAVKGFYYAGAGDAHPSPEIIEALHAPDLDAIVICPSNPYHTIRPILEIQGMRELLRARGVPIVAVTPIVGDRAVKGSAAKMMRELGHEVSARSVALEYYRLIDGFVIDEEDAAFADGIRACGMDVIATQTFMRSIEDRTALAESILKFASAIRERKLREAES